MSDQLMTQERGGPPLGFRSLKDKQGNARRRERWDRGMRILLLLLVGTAVLPLASIVGIVIARGWAAFGWEFLTQVEPFSYRAYGGGYVHGIVGTLYMVGIAALLTVPIGIGAAVYLVEFGRGRLADLIRFFTDVMTGIPSIFVGLFVYALLVTRLRFGTFVGGFALAVLMLPIIVRSSEEMLKLVPQELKRASYALGARRWQTVLKVVLPAARPGLITGCMLAVARAAGETAPLILTALGARSIVLEFQGTAQAAVTLLMFRGSTQPFEAGIARAWSGALLLMGLVLIMTILARLISSRSELYTRR